MLVGELKQELSKWPDDTKLFIVPDFVMEVDDDEIEKMALCVGEETDVEVIGGIPILEEQEEHLNGYDEGLYDEDIDPYGDDEYPDLEEEEIDN